MGGRFPSLVRRRLFALSDSRANTRLDESFYFLTFVLDLWPAAKTSPRHLRRIGAKEDGEKGLVGDHTRESTPRGTIDSAGYPDQRMAGEDGLRPMSERPRI